MADDLLVIDVEVEDDFVLETTGTTVEIEVPEPVLAVISVDGPRGPRGPAGNGGHTHVQDTPAAVWTISHGMARKPAGVSVWLDDELVETGIEAPDLDIVVVTFSAPQSGRAEII